MTIRNMTLSDLEIVLDWARQEGWNPGLEDAHAFLAADPNGFFVKEVGGKLAAAISVVNHSDGFAFLGLYICKPEFRGQGHGLDLWRVAIAYADRRCIGLDGVPDQQENYRRSGFELSTNTIRYNGVLPVDGASLPSTGIQPASLLAADAGYCGYSRPKFAHTWFNDTETRHTFIVDEICFATARACCEGVKIGPFYAQNEQQTTLLFKAISNLWVGQTMTIDIPKQSAALIAFVSGLQFRPVFETARMYAGTHPLPQPPIFAAVATLELG